MFEMAMIGRDVNLAVPGKTRGRNGGSADKFALLIIQAFVRIIRAGALESPSARQIG